jgi:cytoskeletal protein RodZ
LASQELTGSFGAKLKHAREARGVSLGEIAAATKISVGALEALERNEVRRLPGGIFGRAMVRTYATKVGLDPETTVNEFLSELTRAERERARVTRRPDVTPDDRQFLERQRRALRILRIATALILAALLLGIIWYVWGRPGTAGKDRVEAPPPTTQPAAPPAPAVAEAPAPAVTPVAVPEQSAQLLIEFEVNADCWVRLTGDGKVLLDRRLSPAGRQRFAATRSLVIELGNAGAFSWSINGKPAKSLGKSGATTKVTVTPATVSTFWQ